MVQFFQLLAVMVVKLKISDCCIVVPVVDEKFVTAHTEGWQAYLWHFLVSHPELNPEIPKWESIV